MAKKKTPGSDTPDATPAARRRATRKSTDAAAIASPADVPETTGSSSIGAIAQANDTNNGSGARHSAEGPSYEQIAEAAYQRYLQRGAEHGRDFEDWVEAERELRSNR
jgi:hypothetical protein